MLCDRKSHRKEKPAHCNKDPAQPKKKKREYIRPQKNSSDDLLPESLEIIRLGLVPPLYLGPLTAGG